MIRKFELRAYFVELLELESEIGVTREFVKQSFRCDGELYLCEELGEGDTATGLVR